jgi:hypothetical protein
VLSRTAAASPAVSWARPSAARRSGSVRVARAPARVAAPLGPEEMPSRSRSATARSASWSVTATAASQPDRSTGQAELDTVPQLSPAITVAAVVTGVACPAARLASTQAAVSGSATSTLGRVVPGRR